MKIDNITELATVYQKSIYPEGAPDIQIRETKQAYLAGMYEGLQLYRQTPKETLSEIELELRKYFDIRIKELKEVYGVIDESSR
jgi:hypothetical protein